jgi:DUF1680 family protein
MEVYRCCQHNVSHGWPYYAEELWLATADKGLAISLYAASEVKAKVGRGVEVIITEETDYPFSDTIKLKLAMSDSVHFPLHLRIPNWADEAKIQVNGRREKVPALPSTFAVVDRQWQPGDTVTVTFPMKARMRTWAKNQNAVCGLWSADLLTEDRRTLGKVWEESGLAGMGSLSRESLELRLDITPENLAKRSRW